MSIKNQILYEVYGRDVRKMPENETSMEKGMTSFFTAFFEDVQEYGLDKTMNMYETLYGVEVGNELTELKESIEDFVGKMLNEADSPYYTKSVGTIDNIKGATHFSDVKKYATHGRARDTVPTAEALAHGKKIGNQTEKIEAAKESVKNFVNNTGTGLAGLWQRVKDFFGGQFSSIKSIAQSGNWSQILTLPIFKGALAAGGVVAVLAILKKIFGKKKIEDNETKIRQQMAAAKK